MTVTAEGRRKITVMNDNLPPLYPLPAPTPFSPPPVPYSANISSPSPGLGGAARGSSNSDMQQFACTSAE